jgi:hypothetical protein
MGTKTFMLQQATVLDLLAFLWNYMGYGLIYKKLLLDLPDVKY